MIFTAVDLLEVSQVAIPALPSALATARRHINVAPLASWAEQALDTRQYGSVGRGQLEAICRACNGRTADPSPYQTILTEQTAAGRAARVQRARELAQWGRDPMARSPEEAAARLADRTW